ncbi:hypothetical protein BW730_15775 [Tessaracoccus aquimaris]|uniref:DUF1345 domain-containing protein n=1 Tax=Tessaracoccus aquimaris TaxID=1332264 RepID=A0A1Q2CRK2_9ACTN|nr:DUF1345 domain-containing protein [Tessaracoccus aquimaris]AQP48746.1 hypothetical protein BW730_15775 [Tessaracoccus aquimaris]
MEATAAPERRFWPRSETVRALLSSGSGVVLGVAGGLLLAQAIGLGAGPRLILVLCLMATTFSLCHGVATYFTFRGLRGDELNSAMCESVSPHKSRLTTFLVGADGPVWSVSIALVAMFAVLFVLTVPDLEVPPVVLAVTIVMVIASWLDVAITYAAYYARLDRLRTALIFPDHHARSFSDYLYLAFAVQATFGTTDVSTARTYMRRALTGHALLAFVFNTVIVAILVSLLVGGAQG